MKHYWLVFWLERWPDDGAVKAFKTAVNCETLARAVELAEIEIRFRAKNNGTEYWIYSAGVANKGVADLVGRAETDVLGIEWPE